MEDPKRCLKCRGELEPIKNGFKILDEQGQVRTTDLWGCLACNRFEIWGIPPRSAPWWPIHAIVEGKYEVVVHKDPKNRTYPWWLMRDPVLHLNESFKAYMAEWYPHWCPPAHDWTANTQIKGWLK